MGVLGQQGNRSPERLLNVTIERPKVAPSSRPELDSIVAHDHPRSCFTCPQGMLSLTSDIAEANAEVSSISDSRSRPSLIVTLATVRLGKTLLNVFGI